MAKVSEDGVRRIVEEVVQQVLGSGTGSASTAAGGSGAGLFRSADEAVTAAGRAQRPSSRRVWN